MCRRGSAMLGGRRVLDVDFPSVTGQLQGWMNLSPAVWPPAQPLIVKCSSRSSDLIHAGPSNLLLSTRLCCTELPSYPRISCPCILADELQCVYIFNFFFSSNFQFCHYSATYPSSSDSSINVPARTRFLELYLISAPINCRPK